MNTPPAEQADLEFAVAAATAAGTRTLEWFQRNDLDVQTKADGSPVTAADKAAERLIRERLAEHQGDDGILGEEEGEVAGTTDRIWVVDPIDGTKAFTRGVPLYSVLVALVDEHGPAIGVVHFPALDETLAAGRGLGARWNDRPCSVSDRSGLDGAVLCTSGTDYWDPATLASVLASPVTFRTWGDAYGYALVATGRAEAMVDCAAAPWDVAPMAVILPEAGGRFTTIEGDAEWRGGSGLASNGRLHDPILELLHPPAAG